MEETLAKMALTILPEATALRVLTIHIGHSTQRIKTM
jgi:hypothetical protein